MSRLSPSDVTSYLQQLEEGQVAAVDHLLPHVLEDLRALARRAFRDQRKEHTLQPTALVNEAYMRLVGAKGGTYESRKHFLGVAAMAMRQILADHARRLGRDKRREPGQRIQLEDVTPSSGSGGDVDLVALDIALEKLQSIEPRQAKIVELRYLAGLTCDEVAELVGVSEPTVRLDWRMARAWLRREIRRTAE